MTQQGYDGELKILVIDGGSTDRTLEIVAEFPDVESLNNPHQVQSLGLNLGAAHASSEILVRADAHSRYASDYVQRSVDILLQGEAQAVGGPMRPEGQTPFERALAAAMQAPLAIGTGKFHSAKASGPVDTVYLGSFYRQHFLERGGFRHFRSGVAEDADMYFRWRKQGDTIYLDPDIRTTYRPRSSVQALWKQFLRYGSGKAEMWKVNGELPSWRPLAPLALVLSLLFGSVVALAGQTLLLVLVAVGWALVIAVAWTQSRHRSLWIPVLVATMHLSYGLGLLWSLMRPINRD